MDNKNSFDRQRKNLNPSTTTMSSVLCRVVHTVMTWQTYLVFMFLSHFQPHHINLMICLTFCFCVCYRRCYESGVTTRFKLLSMNVVVKRVLLCSSMLSRKITALLIPCKEFYTIQTRVGHFDGMTSSINIRNHGSAGHNLLSFDSEV